MKVVVTDLNPNKLIVHLSSLKICIETMLPPKLAMKYESTNLNSNEFATG